MALRKIDIENTSLYFGTEEEIKAFSGNDGDMAFASGGNLITGVTKEFSCEGGGTNWVQVRSATDGVSHVAEVGIVNLRHNRFLDSVTNSWPGNDTFSVTFTQTENVRRYRIYVTGGVAGNYVKVAEDAANEAQAEAWLGDASSSSSQDVEHNRVHTASPVSATTQQTSGWSKWFDLSKHDNDISLSRLDFLGSAAGPFEICVEAE